MLSARATIPASSRKPLKFVYTSSLRPKSCSSPAKLTSIHRYSTAEVSTVRQSSDFASRHLSDLGLRSQRPPDSIPELEPDKPPEIPDQEWLIRTGRAIYVLQETLPEFFKIGLITSVDKVTGIPGRPSSATTPTANVNFLEHHVLDHDNEESIYSPKVRLSYTPPVELPAPFPKTFHIDGLQMYLASSSLIRHTMNALYSDLAVANTKLVINTPSAPSVPPGQLSSTNKKQRINRDKSILLRQRVTGIARVSGAPGEWEMYVTSTAMAKFLFSPVSFGLNSESTYTFSPLTGLLHRHVINSIRPAPHVAVYDYLRSSLGKLLRLEWGGGSPTPNGAAFKGKIQGLTKGGLS